MLSEFVGLIIIFHPGSDNERCPNEFEPTIMFYPGPGNEFVGANSFAQALSE